MKKVAVIFLVVALLLIVAAPAYAQPPAKGGRYGENAKVVYVTSQDLYYDTIVTVPPEKGLPWKGPFQELEMAGPTGLQTEFGPGDPGYVGGRWWVDANPNGYQDADDVYFLCPLLGPGREAP